MVLSVTSAVFVPFKMRDKNGSHISKPERKSSFIGAGMVAASASMVSALKNCLMKALVAALAAA